MNSIKSRNSNQIKFENKEDFIKKILFYYDASQYNNKNSTEIYKAFELIYCFVEEGKIIINQGEEQKFNKILNEISKYVLESDTDDDEKKFIVLNEFFVNITFNCPKGISDLEKIEIGTSSLKFRRMVLKVVSNEIKGEIKDIKGNIISEEGNDQIIKKISNIIQKQQ